MFAHPGIVFDYETSGNLGGYINGVSSETCALAFASCDSYEIFVNLPLNDLELGNYEVDFIVVDFAGNELIISDDELDAVADHSNIVFANLDDQDLNPPSYYIDTLNGPSINIQMPNQVEQISSIFQLIWVLILQIGIIAYNPQYMTLKMVLVSLVLGFFRFGCYK